MIHLNIGQRLFSPCINNFSNLIKSTLLKIKYDVDIGVDANFFFPTDAVHAVVQPAGKTAVTEMVCASV